MMETGEKHNFRTTFALKPKTEAQLSHNFAPPKPPDPTSRTTFAQLWDKTSPGVNLQKTQLQHNFSTTLAQLVLPQP
jgi:hypothetical protein